MFVLNRYIDIEKSPHQIANAGGLYYPKSERSRIRGIKRWWRPTARPELKKMPELINSTLKKRAMICRKPFNRYGRRNLLQRSRVGLGNFKPIIREKVKTNNDASIGIYH